MPRTPHTLTLEPSDSFHEKYVTAKQPHVCAFCQLAIPANARYKYIAGKFKAGWISRSICLNCAAREIKSLLTVFRGVDVAALKEQHRCVGLVLKTYAELKAKGFLESADVIDQLATEMEHPELTPSTDDEEGA